MLCISQYVCKKDKDHILPAHRGCLWLPALLHQSLYPAGIGDGPADLAICRGQQNDRDMPGHSADAQPFAYQKHQYFTVRTGHLLEELRVAWICETSLLHGVLVDGCGNKHVHFATREVLGSSLQTLYGEAGQRS